MAAASKRKTPREIKEEEEEEEEEPEEEEKIHVVVEAMGQEVVDKLEAVIDR